MSQYWLIASASGSISKDNLLSALKSRIAEKNKLSSSVMLFDVPDNLKFGSFDSLIKLVDDLAKVDGNVEGIVRRVERHLLDMSPTAELKVFACCMLAGVCVCIGYDSS